MAIKQQLELKKKYGANGLKNKDTEDRTKNIILRSETT